MGHMGGDKRAGDDPDRRPDPDAILRRLQRVATGRLKVFLGLAPGVGKTYAMLQEAHDLLAAGVDVVAGVIDTHGRADTEALLKGIPLIPPLETPYRGHRWQDLDVEEALRRRPQLLLVDELAHRNVPGAARAKRWQDVEYLLSRGQNVCTTLNVQHLESLNDAILQMTGVRVNETVPDTFLQHAADIRMVDLSPDDLRERLSQGKIYPPEVAGRAKDNFFRTGNLTALRELTLRAVADYADERLRGYLDEHRIEGTWRARERILVAVTAEPHARRLVRRGFRLASRLRGEFHVCHVRRPDRPPDPRFAPELEATLALARDLGAEVHLLDGNVYEQILDFVTRHRITNLVMGVSLKGTGRGRLFRASLLDALQKAAPDMDILLVGQPTLRGHDENPDD